MRQFLAVPGIYFLLSLLSCAYDVNLEDQRHLRRHFNLSEDTTLLEYSGYPAMVGFGQREGLKIQAVFQLSDAQVEEIVNQGRQVGWRKLPMPSETLTKLPYNNAEGKVQIKLPFAASEGYFLCKTAGSDVLTADNDETYLCENHPGNLHCSEPMTMEAAQTSDKCNSRFGDQILGILELQTNKLYTFVGSTY